ncbi:MAG TPA: hypothetical protein PLP19_09905 [bacterium]|nr:hypothetical protein [bacterium]HPN43791.1 hypothetical protein [bacterium]
MYINTRPASRYVTKGKATGLLDDRTFPDRAGIHNSGVIRANKFQVRSTSRCEKIQKNA